MTYQEFKEMKLARGTDVALLLEDGSIYRGRYWRYDDEFIILENPTTDSFRGVNMKQIKEIFLDTPLPFPLDATTVKVTVQDTHTRKKAILRIEKKEGNSLDISVQFFPGIHTDSNAFYMRLTWFFIRALGSTLQDIKTNVL